MVISKLRYSKDRFGVNFYARGILLEPSISILSTMWVFRMIAYGDLK